MTKTSRIIPKVGDKVRYIPKGGLEWREADVFSRAGKSTGIHKNRLNISEGGEEMSLDFVSGVDVWEKTDANDGVSESGEVYIANDLQHENI